MPSIAPIYLSAGLIIVALAVIALAFWVAKLSSRLRSLNDMIMNSDEPLQVKRTLRGPSTQAESMSAYHGATAASSYQQQSYEPSYAVSNMQNMQQSANGGYGSASYGTYDSQVPYEQPYQVTYPQGGFQPLQNANGQVSAGLTGAGMSTSGSTSPMDEEFFESYKTSSESAQTGSFGRTRPTIPFGEDKNKEEKRESYMRDAVDTGYDPDSIDFSRVAGYKRRRTY